MQAILWGATVVMFVLFIFLATVNGSVPWFYFVEHKEPPSWVPLLGGIFGAIALFIVPVPGAKHWWLLPFFLDYGSIPGLTHTLISYLLRIWRKHD